MLETVVVVAAAAPVVAAIARVVLAGNSYPCDWSAALISFPPLILPFLNSRFRVKSFYVVPLQSN